MIDSWSGRRRTLPAGRSVFRERDSYACAGDAATWELSGEEPWNVHRYPDPADEPSGLFEHLA